MAVGAFLALKRVDAAEAGQLAPKGRCQPIGVDVLRQRDDREDARAGGRRGETARRLELPGKLADERPREGGVVGEQRVEPPGLE